MERIKELEKDLAEAFQNDQKTWTKFYILMKEIEEKELFKPEHASFTAWLKSFCLENKIPESVVWNRKKAGKTYERFVELQSKKGLKHTDLANASVSMDSLVLIDKIAKKAPEIESELISKALNKELTREDLRSAYKKIKAEQKEEQTQSNSNNTESNYKRAYSEKEMNDKVTAVQIVQKIKDTTDWLDSIHKRREVDPNKFKKRVTFDPKYKCFDEFPVYTGTTSLSRRVDILVAENMAVREHFELNIHGIEIKVSKSDLTQDTKYIEYSEFVNYLWIAIPKELSEAAVQFVPEKLGILTYTKNKMLVSRVATRLDPSNIESTLRVIALKSI